MNDVVKDVMLADVVIDETLYPRKQFDQDAVNRYRQAIDNLPPIEITHENYLIDGYHRLMAHRIEQRETIRATVEELDRDSVLWESARRNASHGLQLSQADKSSLGRKFFEQGKSIEEIAVVLSVTDRAIRDWTKALREAANEERDQKIIDMYLACNTWEAIAGVTGYSDKAAALNRFKTLQNGTLSELQPPASLQLYNLWNFHDNDDRYGLNYPGRIPGQIVENLLYYYTEPFDTVVDPMAGGGTTIDVCKAMLRRYRAYDINPVREDIKKHDATTGLHPDTKNCNFIFLDPPYWKQKRGSYSGDETNVANLELEEFYSMMDTVFVSAKTVLTDGGHIAVIIGPTQEGGKLYDHAFELNKLLENHFQFVNRIIVPYTTQQHGGAYVNNAKESKNMLYLYRDLVVFQNG